MSRSIRALGPDDARVYKALRLEGLEREPKAFGRSLQDEQNAPLEDTRSRLSNPHSLTLGAFLDGQLVGISTLARQTNEKERHKAHVYGVYVAEGARGRGVARSLLTHLIAHAASLEGVEQLQLSVAISQSAARRLYESLGFVVYGLEPRALKVGDEYVDEEHMILRLNDGSGGSGEG